LWVKNKGNTVMLSYSTRKPVKSVLRTREEESEVVQQVVDNQQGTNDNGGDSAGARNVVQYESDRDDHPRFGGRPWCARGAAQVRWVAEESEKDKESDSESEDSDDESRCSRE
jgi:hypothetical protein